jgi:hypothetical protein
MFAIFVMCACFIFILILVGGSLFGYSWYKKVQDEKILAPQDVIDASVPIRKFYCNKEFTYCLRSDNPQIAVPPSNPPGSKWVKFHNSCEKCIGRYYYMFSSDTLATALVLMMSAQTPEEIDASLDLLKLEKISDNCKDVLLKNRVRTECMFLTAEGDVTDDVLGALYKTVRNTFGRNIPKQVMKAWYDKYAGNMDYKVVGNTDPFLVLLWLGMDEVLGNSVNIAIQKDPESFPCTSLSSSEMMKGCM